MNPTPLPDNFRNVEELRPGQVRPVAHWDQPFSARSSLPPTPEARPGELSDDELRQCRMFGSFVLWMALITALIWIIWLGLRILQTTLACT